MLELSQNDKKNVDPTSIALAIVIFHSQVPIYHDLRFAYFTTLDKELKAFYLVLFVAKFSV